MGFFRRLFGGKRRKDRVNVQIPVQIHTKADSPPDLRTRDLSETGMRMDVDAEISLSSLTGGDRDVELSIHIKEGGDPVLVFAELVWTTRQEDGTQTSGWMYQRFLKDGQNRLAAFIQSTGMSE